MYDKEPRYNEQILPVPWPHRGSTVKLTAFLAIKFNKIRLQ